MTLEEVVMTPCGHSDDDIEQDDWEFYCGWCGAHIADKPWPDQ